MTHYFTDLLSTLLPGIIIAILTSFLTVRLSLRRFYSERWWERKAEAYSTILESLFNIKSYVDDLITSYEENTNIPVSERDKLASRWKEGHEEIKKIAAIGTFTISEKVYACINGLRKDLKEAKRQANLYEQLCLESTALDNCLREIREFAKNDLKVK